ncbi:unnamed protein product [Ilex paraguariensis]|uniref:Uncharacterized protein n=1 Tax=Ilex paraguariensis TaxID=185542 RepID=A0ABC8QSE5_9AQUA
MAPKTHSLSSLSSVSAFPLLQFSNPSPNILRLYPSKPTLVFCKVTHSQTPQDHFSVSTPEPEGFGAAAPTRGEIFLERQQSLDASAMVLEATKKRRKRKEKVLKVSAVVYSCYGCGAPLQTSEIDAPGYVDPDTYELKKKHHQLRTVLCGRCHLLSHGHMITAVGGNGGYSGGKQFVSAEELREKLSYLCHEKALIVKLVSLTVRILICRELYILPSDISIALSMKMIP